MRIRKYLVAMVISVVVIAGDFPERGSGQVVWSDKYAAELSDVDLACKARMGPISQSDGGASGSLCHATCSVISQLKGYIGQETEIVWRYDKSPNSRGLDAIKAGEVYIVMLRGKTSPYEMTRAIKAVDGVVEPKFGPWPGDRLLAELVAMCESGDVAIRTKAVEQIGMMKDSRGSEEVHAAAKSQNPDLARAGLIAQYRIRIAPDANRVVELLNEQMLEVLRQESGIREKALREDALPHPKALRPFLERGLLNFDYATFIREGLKKPWIRRDDHALSLFFGIPWVVQRRRCVPELVNCLDHSDQKVRWWAVRCLTHTIEDKDQPQWEDYLKKEDEELAKWRGWWDENKSNPAFIRIPRNWIFIPTHPEKEAIWRLEAKSVGVELGLDEGTSEKLAAAYKFSRERYWKAYSAAYQQDSDDGGKWSEVRNKALVDALDRARSTENELFDKDLVGFLNEAQSQEVVRLLTSIDPIVDYMVKVLSDIVTDRVSLPKAVRVVIVQNLKLRDEISRDIAQNRGRSMKQIRIEDLRREANLHRERMATIIKEMDGELEMFFSADELEKWKDATEVLFQSSMG